MYKVQLTEKELIVLIDLLNVAVGGDWYTNECFDEKHFKTHNAQEKCADNLLSKLEKLKTMANLTQDQCKDQFKDSLNEFYNKLQVIDKETPYSFSEPKWWLKMSDLMREIQKIKKDL